MQEVDEVVTIVDNPTSQANVTRMAQKAGWQVRVEEKENGTYLHLSRGEAALGPAPEPVVKAEPAAAAGGLSVLLFTSDKMGSGPEELGRILMRAFLHTLSEVSPLPDTMVFITDSVRLVCEGSEALDDLRALADQGVEILACGTCLGFFGLKEKLAVGEVSNMYTIAETLLQAGKVVQL